MGTSMTESFQRKSRATALTDTWDLYLEARSSLRRLTRAATHTDSEGVMVEYRQLRLERVILLGVWTQGPPEEAEAAMDELAALAETAGSPPLNRCYSGDKSPIRAPISDPESSTSCAILSPPPELTRSSAMVNSPQVSWLPGSRLDAKVIDRTMLILDIFAQHAKSKEGKAQVSLAQMQYLYTRLRGWGGNLSRQAGGRAGSNGGVGLRGPGKQNRN